MPSGIPVEKLASLAAERGIGGGISEPEIVAGLKLVEDLEDPLELPVSDFVLLATKLLHNVSRVMNARGVRLMVQPVLHPNGDMRGAILPFRSKVTHV